MALWRESIRNQERQKRRNSLSVPLIRTSDQGITIENYWFSSRKRLQYLSISYKQFRLSPAQVNLE